MMWRSDEPEIIITGKQFFVASPNATKPFKNPGAETVNAKPGFPVKNPEAAAALTAESSRRKPKYRIPLRCIIRAKSVTGIPTTP